MYVEVTSQCTPRRDFCECFGEIPLYLRKWEALISLQTMTGI